MDQPTRRRHRKALAASWSAALLACATLAPAASPAAEGVTPPPPPKRATDTYRLGLGAVLAGPVGNYGLQVGTQITKNVELLAGVVTQSPTMTTASGDVTAEASVSVVTPFLRGRLWPLANHNPIAEVGVALNHYGLAASARDSQGNALTYDRSGNFPIAFAGAGYGWRSDFGLRVTVLVGYMRFLSSTADPSRVTTTGAFDSSDEVEMRGKLDDVTDQLAESRPYVELGVGWTF